MITEIETPESSLMSTLQGSDGRLNRAGFPVLASVLDKKYAKSGAFVVRWLPTSRTVELSDGTTVEKDATAH